MKYIFIVKINKKGKETRTVRNVNNSNATEKVKIFVVESKKKKMESVCLNHK